MCGRAPPPGESGAPAARGPRATRDGGAASQAVSAVGRDPAEPRLAARDRWRPRRQRRRGPRRLLRGMNYGRGSPAAAIQCVAGAVSPSPAGRGDVGRIVVLVCGEGGGDGDGEGEGTEERPRCHSVPLGKKYRCRIVIDQTFLVTDVRKGQAKVSGLVFVHFCNILQLSSWEASPATHFYSSA